MKRGLRLFAAFLILAIFILFAVNYISGSASNNPSGLTSDGQYTVGQRKSDNKWQIIYVQNTSPPYLALYQTLYNPQISSDASMTVFATAEAANNYKVSLWSKSLKNSKKALSPLSSNIASANYQNLAPAKSALFFKFIAR